MTNRTPFSMALVGLVCMSTCSTAGSGPQGSGGGGGGHPTTGSESATSTSAGGAPATTSGGPATTGAASSGSTSAASSGAGTSGASSGSTSSGTGGGATCPGVPIVPDATGFVAAGSNSVGIHGSWFVYSDCTDLKGKNCAMVTSPVGNGFANVGGKLCTSGQTSTATGAWGAGIGLELNDGPPQMPYDTVAHGVKGFCFVLSGATIPSTTIRVAFPTKDNNDNAYFEAVSTPGMHTVLFADTAQGSWVTTKTAFEPTLVTLMQFQIPSSTSAPVPWDFCIEGVTAITQ
jgi:hypothetical protein